MKKVLFVQSEHTLAKLCHNMGFADILSRNGFDVAFAVSKHGSKFLASNSRYRYKIVPQLWEKRPESHFINRWFQDPQHIETVFDAELALIRKEKPDVVVNNVSYTAKLACKMTGVSMISVIPPLLSSSKRMFRKLYYKKSLTPEVKQKLNSVTDQWEANWWGSWVDPFSKLLKRCKCKPINDIRSLLLGDFQLIHSVPEYDKVNVESDKYEYTGPLVWQGWKHNGSAIKNLHNTVLCSFGTKKKQELGIIHKTIGAIQKLKEVFFVVHAENAVSLQKQYSHFKNVLFVDSYNAEKLLPVCRAVFCQGGYSLVLLCMKFGIPILAAPFQMEQMYHAKKLEQKGVGICLTSMPKIEELSKHNMGGNIFMERISLLDTKTIYDGLHQIIYNNKYRQAAVDMSKHIKNSAGCASILKILNSRSWQGLNYHANR